MAEVQIKKMRISHEMILNWLVMNPEKSQGECAKVFGVTEGWLSVVINSDCFQARWMGRRLMLEKGAVGLAELKMRGVVDTGLNRLEEMVAASPDPKFVLETTDKLLGRMGYGPKTGPAIQINTQNNYAISRDVLAQARGMITDGGTGPALEVLEEVNQRAEGTAVPPEDVIPQLDTVFTPEPEGLGATRPDALSTGGVQYPQNPFKSSAKVKTKLIVPLPARRFS